MAEKVKCIACAHFIMKIIGETEARRIKERHMLTVGFAKCEFVKHPQIWKLAIFERPYCDKYQAIDAERITARQKLFDDRRL